jgi:hypothetical protein
MIDFHEQICPELFNLIPFLAMKNVAAFTGNQLKM